MNCLSIADRNYQFARDERFDSICEMWKLCICDDGSFGSNSFILASGFETVIFRSDSEFHVISSNLIDSSYSRYARKELECVIEILLNWIERKKEKIFSREELCLVFWGDWWRELKEIIVRQAHKKQHCNPSFKLSSLFFFPSIDVRHSKQHNIRKHNVSSRD